MLGFRAGRARKPWKLCSLLGTVGILAAFVPRPPAPARQRASFEGFSPAPTNLSALSPSVTRREKTTWPLPESAVRGTFSAYKCAQFESSGLFFFHLLWYAYLMPCPRLDLICCTLVLGDDQPLQKGPDSLLFSLFSLLAHYSDLLSYVVVLFAHEMPWAVQLIGYE